MLRTTLRQLEIFVAIAQAGTVTEAADKVGLTQSAASMALGELERNLDTLLFDRISKKLVLNENGRALYPKTMELLNRARELENSAGTRSTVTDLRLGASSTIGNYLLPQIISSYITAHPGSRINLDVANTLSTISAVNRHEIDIGFVEGPCHAKDVKATLWREDRLAICAGINHPLAKKTVITPKDLIESNWILREPGSGTREVTDSLLAEQLGPIGVVMEFGGTEAIKRAVESGLGISCLPCIAVQEAVELGKMVCLPTPFLKLERQLYLVLHKTKYQTQGLSAFLAHCTQTAAG
ncbi:LysR family transcriptional regulator [Govanella unica]|uniref:LysR family transcriptional regulator n=1 Tax=Govanella unica TaxID=2975056 RepID=A0A9X3TZU0_9PROT|nr:LysR family transcriptional regulator [Govania unica]MDA5194991.1 LysR family transcriptional regulator [Govania unica]